MAVSESRALLAFSRLTFAVSTTAFKTLTLDVILPGINETIVTSARTCLGLIVEIPANTRSRYRIPYGHRDQRGDCVG